MSNDLQKSLRERAKAFLQIEGEHGLFELVELLRQFRNNTHPDRVQDQELKVKAESQFKEAQALLDECGKQMEVELYSRKPNELAIYRPFYDAVQMQSELDKAKKELEDVKYELKSERENNDDLRKQLQVKKDESLKAEIEHLQAIYTPSPRNYASIGLAILLSGALGVMSQMERASGILEKYSPSGKEYIGTGLFICLVLLLASMLRKLWEREYIKRRSEEICSPKCAGEFMKCLDKRTTLLDGAAIFSEVDAFDFIAGDNQRVKEFISSLGFQIYRRDTTNRLKDIFIHSLLNKKLIEFSKAQRLQRHFTIVNAKDESDWWRDQWRKEKAKNEALSKTEKS
jgi:hypothetical protein